MAEVEGFAHLEELEDGLARCLESFQGSRFPVEPLERCAAALIATARQALLHGDPPAWP